MKAFEAGKFFSSTLGIVTFENEIFEQITSKLKLKSLVKFVQLNIYLTVIGELKSIVVQLDKRVQELEKTKPHLAICPAKSSDEKEAPKAEEDDVDLFGSDSEASGKLDM